MISGCSKLTIKKSGRRQLALLWSLSCYLLKNSGKFLFRVKATGHEIPQNISAIFLSDVRRPSSINISMSNVNHFSKYNFVK